MAKHAIASSWEPGILVASDPSDGDRAASVLKERSGAAALLWAILMDGIRTYCTGMARGDTSSLAFREAEHWLFGLQSDALTSFENLCRVFDIDPRVLRRRLRAYADGPSADFWSLLDREAA